MQVLTNALKLLITYLGMLNATSNEYKNRHDKIGKYLHWKIRHETGMNIILNLYLWEQMLQSSGIFLSMQIEKIQATRPDIIIKGKKIAHWLT